MLPVATQTSASPELLHRDKNPRGAIAAVFDIGWAIVASGFGPFDGVVRPLVCTTAARLSIFTFFVARAVSTATASRRPGLSRNWTAALWCWLRDAPGTPGANNSVAISSAGQAKPAQHFLGWQRARLRQFRAAK